MTISPKEILLYGFASMRLFGQSIAFGDQSETQQVREAGEQ